jgi:hypothetical protein
MPVLEIEVNDDGSFGKLPDTIQTFFNKKIAEAKRDAEARTEAKMTPYLADPAELERLRQRDKVLADVELKEAERVKDYEKARKIQEEAHAKDRADAVAAEKKQTAKAIERVKAGVGKSIRAAALANGARAESLEELERLLSADIDLDDELNEYVVDAKDRKAPRLDADGKPVPIEGLVADYLKTHPHHVAAAPGAGGGARGGATFTGARVTAATDDRSKARLAVAENPTAKNVGALLRTAMATKSA